MLLSSFSIKLGFESFTYLKNVFMNTAVSSLETKTVIFILSLRHFKNVCRFIIVNRFIILLGYFNDKSIYYFFIFWTFILEKLDKDENIILIKLQIIIIYLSS